MGLIQKILGAGAKVTVGEIGRVVDKLTTSGEERNDAKTKALTVLLETQTRIIEAEARAGGLAAIWRPIASLSFVALVWWCALAGPFGWPPPDIAAVPDQLWWFLMGYGGVRSAEKILPMFDKMRRRKIDQRNGQEGA